MKKFLLGLCFVITLLAVGCSPCPVCEPCPIPEPSSVEPSSTTPTSTTTSNTTQTNSTTSSSGLTNLSAYYSAAQDLTGTELKNSLRSIMTSGHKPTTYKNLNNMLRYSDIDPNNSSNLILFYSRVSVNGAWDSGTTYNKEHVWPQSLSNGIIGTDSGPGGDLHHIRPVDSKINSTRGNKPYADLGKSGSTAKVNSKIAGYYSGGYWEPIDEVKGDVARILMYLITRYANLDDIFYKSGTSPVKNGDISLLLKWNKLDPVDDLERARNEYAYSIQKNRNAFIDYPEFANLIWS